MQSGISASQELQTAFQSFVSDSSQRGLLATISKEQLIPSATISSESPDFLSDLTPLAPHLKDNEAAYVILRRYPDASDGFVAITYVPDSAPVRQKMLFASTRLTLVRELGIERFRETIFATTKAELTAEGFQKHDQHAKLAAPLTEEEESLGAVKQAEAEEGRGMGVKRSHLTDRFSMNVSDDALSALRKLAGSTDGDNLVQLKIDISTEVIELAATSSTTPASLSSTISSTEPRYSLYKYTHESDDGTPVSSIIFIYTCPTGSKIKERMLYASSSRALANLVEAEAGLKVDKKLETTDPQEITQGSIEEEFKTKVEVKKAFERPKRPGRR